MTEHVILVDPEDRPMGTMEKMEAHPPQGLQRLHFQQHRGVQRLRVQAAQRRLPR